MATWTGATSGDWDVAGNWLDLAVPTGGTIRFPEDAQVTNAPSTNLDRTGDNVGAGLDLDKLIYDRGASYDIGTAAELLKCTVDIRMELLGSGAVYFKSDTGTGGHTTGHVVVDMGSNSAKFLFTGDTAVARLDVMTGYVDLSSFTGTLTDYYGLPGRAIGAGGVMDVRTGVSITNVYHLAGQLTVAASANFGSSGVHVYGGRVRCNTIIGSTAPTTQIQLYGGTLDYRGGAPVVGLGPDIYAIAGTLDLRNSSEVDGLLDVNELWVYPGATVKRGEALSITGTTHYVSQE